MRIFIDLENLDVPGKAVLSPILKMSYLFDHRIRLIYIDLGDHSNKELVKYTNMYWENWYWAEDRGFGEHFFTALPYLLEDVWDTDSAWTIWLQN